ncbi:MAG: magnesium transporter, partial [Planctomycetota bacterium]
MINPLYLPELREMIAQKNSDSLREFCEALHPARTADFMEGLSAEEAWFVLGHTDALTRGSIFAYFDENFQVNLVQAINRTEIAALVSELAPDDRVDLLNNVPQVIVDELLPLLPSEERHDILHLRS